LDKGAADVTAVPPCPLKFEQGFWLRKNLSVRFNRCGFETAFSRQVKDCPGTCPKRLRRRTNNPASITMVGPITQNATFTHN
jgi:hypothetical protein